MIGSRTGKSPIVFSLVRRMRPSISETSVEVPPISKLMILAKPAALAR